MDGPSDKENNRDNSNFYSRINSPLKATSECKRTRCPLEDFDPNSQDSGYGSRDAFHFAEPHGLAPRRMSIEQSSPTRSSPLAQLKRKSAFKSPLFRTVSSGYESTDDGFNDLIDMESLDDETISLPSGLSNLLSGSINKSMDCDNAKTPESSRPKLNLQRVRRSLSQQLEKRSSSEDEATPPQSRARSCLFRSPNSMCSASKLEYDNTPRCLTKKQFLVDSPKSSFETRSFKRPDPPGNISPLLVKRQRKSTISEDEEDTSAALPAKSRTLNRSLSEADTHAFIKQAITRSCSTNDLTGDFSKICALPLANGNHGDLKAITPSTLAALIRGEFKDTVSSYKIVDCRYPYEFEAGHISGAINLYTKEQIGEFLMDPLTYKPKIGVGSTKRDIVVFHCEFSWERGPTLSRFLRSLDRQKNKEHYPALYYPELYLLNGGYKSFFQEERELCVPQGYTAMRDPQHEADLKQFRSKSKSFQGEKSRGLGSYQKCHLKRFDF